MTVTIERYSRFWQESLTQPKVHGPQHDYWYQRVGRFARAIACEATMPFAVPVGLTAQVSGLTREYAGQCLGQLVRNGVLRVVERGAPGRYTRYVFCLPGR